MEAADLKTRLNLRGHHLAYLIDFCKGKIKEYPFETSWEFYGKTMALYFYTIHNRARENPDLFEITIARGVDDFCIRGSNPNKTCPILERCKADIPFQYAGELIDNWKDDEDYVKKHGLEIGKTYNLKNLLEKR